MTDTSRRFGPGRIIVELLIVFVGVYGAFLLSEHQEGRRTAERARQIQCALVGELASIVEGGQQAMPLFREAYTNWMESYRSGEHPAPLFFSRGGVHRPPTAIWEASQSSDLAELFDVELLHRLSEFYHGLYILMDKNDELYDFAVAHILPQDDDPGAYYRADGVNLKGHYLEYAMVQGKFIDSAEEVIAEGTILLADLRAACGEES